MVKNLMVLRFVALIDMLAFLILRIGSIDLQMSFLGLYGIASISIMSKLPLKSLSAPKEEAAILTSLELFEMFVFFLL